MYVPQLKPRLSVMTDITGLSKLNSSSLETDLETDLETPGFFIDITHEITQIGYKL